MQTAAGATAHMAHHRPRPFNLPNTMLLMITFDMSSSLDNTLLYYGIGSRASASRDPLHARLQVARQFHWAEQCTRRINAQNCTLNVSLVPAYANYFVPDQESGEGVPGMIAARPAAETDD